MCAHVWSTGSVSDTHPCAQVKLEPYAHSVDNNVSLLSLMVLVYSCERPMITRGHTPSQTSPPYWAAPLRLCSRTRSRLGWLHTDSTSRPEPPSPSGRFGNQRLQTLSCEHLSWCDSQLLLLV